MEILQHWLESSNTPFITALLLGLITAISPCPLATNITAIGFISKDIENKRRIFFNGLWYTLGRALSYTTLGVILYFGAGTFRVARFFQANGEKFLGPLLIVVGILMFDFIRLRMPGTGRLGEKIGNRLGNGRWSALLLGMVFALAFCPYSGVLYFGGLIPITISSPYGLYLPLVFAIATGLPVIVAAWLIAFSLQGIGRYYNSLKLFEKWFRRIVAVLFIIAGAYYVYIFYFSP